MSGWWLQWINHGTKIPVAQATSLTSVIFFALFWCREVLLTSAALWGVWITASVTVINEWNTWMQLMRHAIFHYATSANTSNIWITIYIFKAHMCCACSYWDANMWFSQKLTNDIKVMTQQLYSTHPAEVHKYCQK